jgi:hypothetical protein
MTKEDVIAESFAPTIGWSDFAKKQHTPESGNSFTTLDALSVVGLVLLCWDARVPGAGEKDLSRKVLVPLPEYTYEYFRCPRVELTPDLPLKARVAQRQEGEDYYVETYVDGDEADRLGIELKYSPVTSVNVVCYSKEALLDNGGTRSTNCDWEIVCLLASGRKNEKMEPLTMARNYLEKPGGTFTDYTAREFAEAIYEHSTNRGVRVVRATKEKS